MASNDIPTDWDESDQLDGADLYNKTELEGKLFRLRAVEFRSNKAGVQFARFTAEMKDGSFVQFQDSSSTGCLMQIKDYLTERGEAAAIDSDKLIPLALVCPRGLRASEYDRPDPNRPNRTIHATTYYLTSAGDTNVPPVPPKAAKVVQPVKTARKTA
jgi:hypothetical protein